MCLKSKVYIVKTCKKVKDLPDGAKKCKGAPRAIVGRDFTYDMYKSCVTRVNRMRVASTRLQSKDYRMFLLRTRKVALSSIETKRAVMPCAIHTLPYHCKLLREGGNDMACPECHCTVEDMKKALTLYKPPPPRVNQV